MRRKFGTARVLALAGTVVLAVTAAACSTGAPTSRLLDRDPPVHSTPDLITVAAPDANGVHVRIGGATDLHDHDPVVTCDHPGLFPIGDTVTLCTARDRAGNTSVKPVTVRVAPPTGDRVVQVEVAVGTTCVRYQGGTVRCWGEGRYGMLGQGDLLPSLVPVEVPGIPDAIDISLTDRTACALLANHTVRCWGEGILQPNGEFATVPTPVEIPGLADVIDLGQGCAVVAGGSVKCFLYRQTLGTFDDIENAVEIDAPCARIADGTVKCWGSNYYGELGIGTADALDHRWITTVPGLTGVTQIEVGHDTRCALLDDGTVRCWGKNNQGELGNDQAAPPGYGSTLYESSPVQVHDLTDVATISGGNQANCAVRSNGEPVCWGDNELGQLGIGRNNSVYNPLNPSNSFDDYSAVPVPLAGVSSATQIAQNGWHGCAVLTDGTVRCWGTHGYFYGFEDENHYLNIIGGLGDGGTRYSTVPLTVTGLD